MSENKLTLFNFWHHLTPTQKKYLTFSLCALIIIAIVLFSYAGKAPRVRQNVKDDKFDIRTPNLAEETLSEKVQHQLASQARQIADLQRNLEQMTKKNAPKVEPERNIIQDIEKSLSKTEILPSLNTDIYAKAPIIKQIEPPKTSEEKTPQNPNNQPTTQITQPIRSLGVISWTESKKDMAVQEAISPKDTRSKPANEVHNSFYMPTASFFEVHLITGLDAPTGTKAKNSPSPIAFRVQDLAWLPNEMRQNIQGCLLLAEGIGELSTERVNVRGLSLSCVANNGEQVIDQKILGYVADSDGKAGLRGQVVSKAGKLLAETMKVGFLQGLAEFFQFNARSITMNDSGGISSVPKNSNLDNVLMGGGFSGVGKALDKVAKYYMDLAEEVFPVIQVSATRSATFILTQGVQLNFDKVLNNFKGDKNNEEL